MESNSLLGVWTGTAHNSNGWDMKLTLSILQPVEVGTTLGVFDIPFLPCSGALRVVDIREDILEVQAERLQGECPEDESNTLELLPDGTLLYVSKGKDWERRAVLQHTLQEHDEDE